MSIPWIQAYLAGIKADLDKRPRVPPSNFDAKAIAAWFMGYDR